MTIKGLSHVSIVVPDLDAAARELASKYGLKTGAIKVNAEQGVRPPRSGAGSMPSRLSTLV